jgi:hypothetical protein
LGDDGFKNIPDQQDSSASAKKFVIPAWMPESRAKDGLCQYPVARFRHNAKPTIYIHVTGYRHPCQYDGAG